MDFIVKLPESAGYDSILTITDHDCTKMLIAIPCTEKITAEGVAKKFLQQVFPRFGLPSKIISDRDPRFISKFMKELCRLMGITQNVSTAYCYDSFFLPYYTQIHRTAFFSLSPILS